MRTNTRGTQDAALMLGIAPATIRDWRRRQLLTPCGGTERRPVFTVTAIFEAARKAGGPAGERVERLLSMPRRGAS